MFGVVNLVISMLGMTDISGPVFSVSLKDQVVVWEGCILGQKQVVVGWSWLGEGGFKVSWDSDPVDTVFGPPFIF